MPRNRVPKIDVILLSALLLCASTTGFTQSRNNPYSTNPSAAKPKVEDTASVVKPIVDNVAFVTPARDTQDDEARPVIIQRKVKKAPGSDKPLTEVYKIGAGDVLFVNLKNASNASGYYTVRANGTIDFPLAGENLVVAGQTVEEAEETIAAGITLYADPKVEIKIREYASHRITVSGMVERPGEKSIQREAVPLFVIRAEAGVDPRANKVLIRRTELAKVETLDLSAADNTLIYPGTSIEFTTDAKTAGLANSGFYYIAGAINSTGQKELTSGMTLFQAILASGGMKGSPKKASVRRKTEKGTLSLTEYNLRMIKEGKMADPLVLPGDMIEIGN